ncbi:hypothetical protein Ancab_000961 [Ancistrocladus abbreviatus]
MAGDRTKKTIDIAEQKRAATMLSQRGGEANTSYKEAFLNLSCRTRNQPKESAPLNLKTAEVHSKWGTHADKEMKQSSVMSFVVNEEEFVIRVNEEISGETLYFPGEDRKPSSVGIKETLCLSSEDLASSFGKSSISIVPDTPNEVAALSPENVIHGGNGQFEKLTMEDSSSAPSSDDRRMLVRERNLGAKSVDKVIGVGHSSDNVFCKLRGDSELLMQKHSIEGGVVRVGQWTPGVHSKSRDPFIESCGPDTANYKAAHSPFSKEAQISLPPKRSWMGYFILREGRNIKIVGSNKSAYIKGHNR